MIFWKKEGAKSVFFSVVSSIFRGWKRWNVKTRTKTNHNPLYYRGLRSNVWHLWQQKHKNSCTYARMRARERKRLQVFSHNSTPRFSYLDFGHLFCLLWLQIVLWKDTRRLQKMTACFQQNNVSFSIKQRIVFYKTTCRFLINIVLLFHKHSIPEKILSMNRNLSTESLKCEKTYIPLARAHVYTRITGVFVFLLSQVSHKNL